MKSQRFDLGFPKAIFRLSNFGQKRLFRFEIFLKFWKNFLIDYFTWARWPERVLGFEFWLFKSQIWICPFSAPLTNEMSSRSKARDDGTDGKSLWDSNSFLSFRLYTQIFFSTPPVATKGLLKGVQSWFLIIDYPYLKSFDNLIFEIWLRWGVKFVISLVPCVLLIFLRNFLCFNSFSEWCFLPVSKPKCAKVEL